MTEGTEEAEERQEGRKPATDDVGLLFALSCNDVTHFQMRPVRTRKMRSARNSARARTATGRALHMQGPLCRAHSVRPQKRSRLISSRRRRLSMMYRITVCDVFSLWGEAHLCN